jgi:hypothetical protein
MMGAEEAARAAKPSAFGEPAGVGPTVRPLSLGQLAQYGVVLFHQLATDPNLLFNLGVMR